jgi:DNA-binding NarL/FixJ family response regulator
VGEILHEPPIRVFLLIGNRLLRNFLERFFRKRPDILVVGCNGETDCSAQVLLESECDVLVLDFLDAKWLPVNLRTRAGKLSAMKSLLICMNADAEQFLAAVCAGATGYLLKEASAAEVATAVRAMARGETVCPAMLCALLFQYVSRMAASGVFSSPAGRPDLTLRQQQLVGLVAKGLTNKEIAGQLNLSEYTVRNHIHRIMKQVDAGSRSQAVDTILSHGYTLKGTGR